MVLGPEHGISDVLRLAPQDISPDLGFRLGDISSCVMRSGSAVALLLGGVDNEKSMVEIQ